jgi:hypothetical protein
MYKLANVESKLDRYAYQDKTTLTGIATFSVQDFQTKTDNILIGFDKFFWI